MLSNFAHYDPATKQVVIKLNYVNQTFSLEVFKDSGIKLFKQNITFTEQTLEKELAPGNYIFRILESNIITREQKVEIPDQKPEH
jgi:hypothetical protein